MWFGRVVLLARVGASRSLFGLVLFVEAVAEGDAHFGRGGRVRWIFSLWEQEGDDSARLVDELGEVEVITFGFL